MKNVSFLRRLAEAQHWKREWFTTMRLWNLKRAHIDDLYMISIVYFDWNIYCFPNEFWTRAHATKEIFRLDVVMDGRGCVRHIRRKARTAYRMECCWVWKCNRHHVISSSLWANDIRFVMGEINFFLLISFILLRVRCQSHLQEFNWWDLLHCLATVSLSSRLCLCQFNFYDAFCCRCCCCFSLSWPLNNKASGEKMKMKMWVNYNWAGMKGTFSPKRNLIYMYEVDREKKWLLYDYTTAKKASILNPKQTP